MYGLLSKYRSELMGVAMLMVMFFHAFELDTGLWLLNGIRKVGYWGVDIFVFLSAIGLSMSMARQRRTYPRYMLRRGSRIIPAYYIVMIPYTLFLILHRGVGWSVLPLNAVFLSYWLKPEGAFNWYVTGIMALYAIAPLWHSIPRRIRPAATLLAILAAISAYMLLLRLDIWYALDTLFRVPIFLLGLLIGDFITENRKPRRAELALGGAMVVLGALVVVRQLRSRPYVPLCLAFFLMTPALCMALAWCMEKLRLRPLRAFLRFIGTSSLEIYLLNVSVFTETAFFHRFLPSGPGNSLFYLILFAANILLGWLLHQCVEAVRKAIHLKKDTSLSF